MRLPRQLKVRRTDYRPTRAGATPPLERSDARPGAAAWDRLDARATEEKENHDRWVASLSPETAILACNDLLQVNARDRKDPTQRWIMGRKAALLRRIKNERLIPTSPTNGH